MKSFLKMMRIRPLITFKLALFIISLFAKQDNIHYFESKKDSFISIPKHTLQKDATSFPHPHSEFIIFPTLNLDFFVFSPPIYPVYALNLTKSNSKSNKSSTSKRKRNNASNTSNNADNNKNEQELMLEMRNANQKARVQKLFLRLVSLILGFLTMTVVYKGLRSLHTGKRPLTRPQAYEAFDHSPTTGQAESIMGSMSDFSKKSDGQITPSAFSIPEEVDGNLLGGRWLPVVGYVENSEFLHQDERASSEYEKGDDITCYPDKTKCYPEKPLQKKLNDHFAEKFATNTKSRKLLEYLKNNPCVLEKKIFTSIFYRISQWPIWSEKTIKAKQLEALTSVYRECARSFLPISVGMRGKMAAFLVFFDQLSFAMEGLKIESRGDSIGIDISGNKIEFPPFDSMGTPGREIEGGDYERTSYQFAYGVLPDNRILEFDRFKLPSIINRADHKKSEWNFVATAASQLTDRYGSFKLTSDKIFSENDLLSRYGTVSCFPQSLVNKNTLVSQDVAHFISSCVPIFEPTNFLQLLDKEQMIMINYSQGSSVPTMLEDDPVSASEDEYSAYISANSEADLPKNSISPDKDLNNAIYGGILKKDEAPSQKNFAIKMVDALGPEIMQEYAKECNAKLPNGQQIDFNLAAKVAKMVEEYHQTGKKADKYVQDHQREIDIQTAEKLIETGCIQIGTMSVGDAEKAEKELAREQLKKLHSVLSEDEKIELKELLKEGARRQKAIQYGLEDKVEAVKSFKSKNGIRLDKIQKAIEDTSRTFSRDGLVQDDESTDLLVKDDFLVNDDILIDDSEDIRDNSVLEDIPDNPELLAELEEQYGLDDNPRNPQNPKTHPIPAPAPCTHDGSQGANPCSTSADGGSDLYVKPKSLEKKQKKQKRLSKKKRKQALDQNFEEAAKRGCKDLGWDCGDKGTGEKKRVKRQQEGRIGEKRDVWGYHVHVNCSKSQTYRSCFAEASKQKTEESFPKELVDRFLLRRKRFDTKNYTEKELEFLSYHLDASPTTKWPMLFTVPIPWADVENFKRYHETNWFKSAVANSDWIIPEPLYNEIYAVLVSNIFANDIFRNPDAAQLYFLKTFRENACYKRYEDECFNKVEVLQQKAKKRLKEGDALGGDCALINIMEDPLDDSKSFRKNKFRYNYDTPTHKQIVTVSAKAFLTKCASVQPYFDETDRDQMGYEVRRTKETNGNPHLIVYVPDSQCAWESDRSENSRCMLWQPKAPKGTVKEDLIKGQNSQKRQKHAKELKKLLENGALDEGIFYAFDNEDSKTSKSSFNRSTPFLRDVLSCGAFISNERGCLHYLAEDLPREFQGEGSVVQVVGLMKEIGYYLQAVTKGDLNSFKKSGSVTPTIYEKRDAKLEEFANALKKIGVKDPRMVHIVRDVFVPNIEEGGGFDFKRAALLNAVPENYEKYDLAKQIAKSLSQHQHFAIMSLYSNSDNPNGYGEFHKCYKYTFDIASKISMEEMKMFERAETIFQSDHDAIEKFKNQHNFSQLIDKSLISTTSGFFEHCDGAYILPYAIKRVEDLDRIPSDRSHSEVIMDFLLVLPEPDNLKQNDLKKKNRKKDTTQPNPKQWREGGFHTENSYMESLSGNSKSEKSDDSPLHVNTTTAAKANSSNKLTRKRDDNTNSKSRESESTTFNFHNNLFTDFFHEDHYLAKCVEHRGLEATSTGGSWNKRHTRDYYRGFSQMCMWPYLEFVKKEYSDLIDLVDAVVNNTKKNTKDFSKNITPDRTMFAIAKRDKDIERQNSTNNFVANLQVPLARHSDIFRISTRNFPGDLFYDEKYADFVEPIEIENVHDDYEVATKIDSYERNGRKKLIRWLSVFDALKEYYAEHI